MRYLVFRKKKGKLKENINAYLTGDKVCLTTISKFEITDFTN